MSTRVNYRFSIRQPVITPDSKIGTVVANFTNDQGNFTLVTVPSGPATEQRVFEERVLKAAVESQP